MSIYRGLFFLLVLIIPCLAHSSYYEISKPDYDSGWTSAWGQLNHNLGGDIDTYVVDLQFRSDSNTVNQYGFGGMEDGNDGGWWHSLTNSSIQVDQKPTLYYLSEFRVRIWRIDIANYDSGWGVINQGETKVFNHGIGGNTDDFVVYM
jgi:hypothetical protein